MARFGAYVDGDEEIRSFAVDCYLRVVESANAVLTQSSGLPWIPTTDEVVKQAKVISDFVQGSASSR